jgi:hypothetical protein
MPMERYCQREAYDASSGGGLARYSINKVITGDLEATTTGEMFSGGDPKADEAGYVAIEVVTGRLAGKHGSFALQHLGTMDKLRFGQDDKFKLRSNFVSAQPSYITCDSNRFQFFWFRLKLFFRSSSVRWKSALSLMPRHAGFLLNQG